MSIQWTPQYYQKVLAMNPIAYWLLDEKSGTVAYDLVSGRVAGAQNGTHSGVLLWHNGIGDGRRSAGYDSKASSYTDIYSVALNAAFNGQSGSAMGWFKVASAGVWEDGVSRVMLRVYGDANNYIQFLKSSTNNRFLIQYLAALGVYTTTVNGISSVDWMRFGITWSFASDEVKAYWNGAQVGVTLNGVNAWVPGAPPLNNGNTFIGAATAVPANVFDGDGADVALWDRVLSAEEMAVLAVVE